MQSMQSVPLFRVVSPETHRDRFAFTESQADWLAAVRDARARVGSTITAALVNPFDRSITHVQLDAALHVDENRVPGVCRITIYPTSAAEQALLKVQNFGSRALTEDLKTGTYTACVSELAGGTLPRAPGFQLAGRPFVGCGLVYRGVELACPYPVNSTALDLLDYAVDVQPEDYAGVAWLSSKGVQREHERWAESVRAMRGSTHGVSGMQHVDPMEPIVAPRAELGTCWGCRTPCITRNKCDKCRYAYYCNEQCQRAHWPIHKETCKAPKM